MLGLSHNQARAGIAAASAFLVVAIPNVWPDHEWFVIPLQALVTGVAGALTVAPDQNVKKAVRPRWRSSPREYDRDVDDPTLGSF